MWVQEQLLKPVQAALEGIIPESLRYHYQELMELEARLGQSADSPMKIATEDTPFLRRAALHYRYQIALQQERLHERNIDPAHASAIDARTNGIDTDLDEPWMTSVEPCHRPSLTDYVNLKTARSILAGLGQGVFPARRYDDKFGILWPSNSILELLEACRTESWLLRTRTCVAFLDIDDFKKINTLLTETVVDREILPSLMLLLESRTSQRGFAIRQGGDEYVLVYPNSEQEEVDRALNSICKTVATFFPSERRITLSVGYVSFDSNCSITNSEVLLEANRAKNEAKELGKNRVIFRCLDRQEGAPKRAARGRGQEPNPDQSSTT